MNVTTIGIDLAKNTFSLHGADSRGHRVFRKTLPRTKLLPVACWASRTIARGLSCGGEEH